MTGRQRTLAALQGQTTHSYPIWLMRQAGRFLPEYRELRSHCTFLELVRSPALCTEAALQPLRRFDLDATIVFSDILVIPDAIGAGLQFVTGDGPKIERPIRSPQDAAPLDWENIPQKLDYVYAAVEQLRQAAPDHALFGFAGAPWTLFCYLVEGGGSSDFWRPRAMLYQQPELAQEILDRLSTVIAQHLRKQAEAGADIVQIFDTWGGLLPQADYKRFIMPCMRKIVSLLEGIPTVLFVRGGAHLLPLIAELPVAGYSLDANTDLQNAHHILQRCTQGNLDNVRLLGTPQGIIDGVHDIHRALHGRRNHIFNLGHGLLPQTPPESVATFVQTIRSLA